MPTVHFDDNLEAAMAMLSLGEKPESPPPVRASDSLASTAATDKDEVVPKMEIRPAHCVSARNSSRRGQDSDSDAFLDAIEARLARAFRDTGLPAPRAAALTGAALAALDRAAALCPEVRLEDVLFRSAPADAAQGFWETLRARLMAAFCALPRVDPEKAALARALVLAVLSSDTTESDEAKQRREPGPEEDPIVGAYILCRVSEAARADLSEIEQSSG